MTVSFWRNTGVSHSKYKKAWEYRAVEEMAYCVLSYEIVIGSVGILGFFSLPESSISR